MRPPKNAYKRIIYVIASSPEPILEDVKKEIKKPAKTAPDA